MTSAHPQRPRRRIYCDRARMPDETVALVRPHFAELGITRIAKQTGLDTVGIPCFAAVRPNSRSLASNQGKGITDEFAMASAVMEAVEFAIAERPQVPAVRLSREAVERQGVACFDPRRVLPMGYAFPADKPVRWVEGRSLADGRIVMVPYDMVALTGSAPDLPRICQNTNGLASGNSAAEATFHAVCELIERDAASIWSMMSLEQKMARCIAPASLDDGVVDDLLDRFTRAGLAVRLFDQTSDVGIPTIFAVSGPTSGLFAKHYDVATGAGTHPDPARAAIRAITEAAQTRVTAIAGARDDHHPDTYRLNGSGEAFDLLAAQPGAMAHHDHPATNDASELLAHMLGALERVGVDDLVAAELGGERYGVAVVRVVSAQLEDRGPNANWRPGERALSAWSELA